MKCLLAHRTILCRYQRVMWAAAVDAELLPALVIHDYNMTPRADDDATVGHKICVNTAIKNGKQAEERDADLLLAPRGKSQT